VALEAEVAFDPAGRTTGAMAADAEDLNEDGRLDLLVTNFNSQGTSLHTNVGGMRFVDRGNVVGLGMTMFKYSTFGARFLDLDNDGDPDVLLPCVGEPPRLLRNEGGNRNRWRGVRLVGTRSGRDAIGARVAVTAGGRTQALERVDAIEVRWPSGHVDRFPGTAANRYVTLTEES